MKVGLIDVLAPILGCFDQKTSVLRAKRLDILHQQYFIDRGVSRHPKSEWISLGLNSAAKSTWSSAPGWILLLLAKEISDTDLLKPIRNLAELIIGTGFSIVRVRNRRNRAFMTFRPHIHQTVARGKSALGMMKRFAKGFSCPYITKSLYTSS